MSKSVVVVGGGVIGLCSALYLAESGWQVTVLDQNAEDAPGCSTGNAGMVVPSHFVPLAAPGMIAYGLKAMLNPKSPFAFSLKPNLRLLEWALRFMRSANSKHVSESELILRDLNLASRVEYVRLAAELEFDFGLHQRGLLMLCKTVSKFDEEKEIAHRANELGLATKTLNRAQLAKLEPEIEIDVEGAILFEQDCHLTPHLFLTALRKRLRLLGATLRFNEEVQSIEVTKTGEIRSVTTRDGDQIADEFVLAAGIWSDALSRKLKLNLPMVSGKGYSFTLNQSSQQLQHCALLAEARVAVTPMVTGLRIGGTMEIGTPSSTINLQKIKGICESVPDFFPQLRPQVPVATEIWHGNRPCSPDGLPYIGRAANHQNLTIATGHAMMGLSLAPISGKLVSEIINRHRPSVKIEQLSPNRYA